MIKKEIFENIEKLLIYAEKNLRLNREDLAYKRNRILEKTAVFKDYAQTIKFIKEEVFI